jgi:hypothetical protein
MDRSLLWRVALVQALGVAALSLALAAALPHAFFEDFGWIAGPVAWMACAALCARVLSLAPGRTLLGAALAGLPSLLAVVAGIHWLGAVAAIVLFALWCASVDGRSPRRPVAAG